MEQDLETQVKTVTGAIGPLKPGPPRRNRPRRRWLWITLIVLAGLALAIFLGLDHLQTQVLYYPARIAADHAYMLWPATQEFSFQTSAGRQVAFYVPPRERPGDLPDRMWILFHGKHGLGLLWQHLASQAVDARAGFLLYDPPGCGACEGKPSPARILESEKAACEALALRLGAEPDRLFRHLGVMGCSLGTATGLLFAAQGGRKIERIVLVAPFTDTVEMGRRFVGPVLSSLAWHRFDNRARLAELKSMAERPEVTILHGDADTIAPVEMARALAREFAGWVQYRELPKVGHIIPEEEILRAMGP